MRAKIVALAALAGLLAGCTGPDPAPAPVNSSPSSAPRCDPEIGKSGFSQYEGKVSFAVVITSHCPQPIVGRLLVTVLNAAGQPAAGGYPTMPLGAVLLPGQRLTLGESTSSTEKVTRLDLTLDDSSNVKPDVVANWPRSVKVTNLTHSAPDKHGYTQVSGTTVVDPPGARTCSSDYYLALRNVAGKLIFGAKSTKGGPSFDERVPPGVDWSSAEISVAFQGCKKP